jgi:exodeoxyribonuclease V alpha subunit
MTIDNNTNSLKIEGIVKSQKYFDEKSNYYILSVTVSKTDNITICGNGQDIKKNDCISVEGVWTQNKHGKQFKANFINVILPTKKETILEYLSSGIIKGIGKKNAAEMVRLWGDNALNVLDETPTMLLRLSGIGEKKLTKIVNSWDEVRPSEQTVSELIAIGFQNFEAIKIYKKFGFESLTMVKRNPYLIHRRISSISFEKVDAVALTIGIAYDNPQRILATVEHFLREEHRNGDCLINYNYIYNKCLKYSKVSSEALFAQIENGIHNFFFYYIVIDEIGYLQYRTIKNAEDEIARRLFLLYTNKDHKEDESIEYQLQDLFRKGEKKIPFSLEQKRGVKKSINEKVSIITGGPGVGKTSVLNEVLKQLRHLGKNVLLCAPTGKAAQKMTESTGLPSATIHRLLEFNPMQKGFVRNESEPLETDVLVIDESSMIDVFLMSNLLKAINDSTQVIILGDVDQLPSVQSGAVLRDILNSGFIPSSMLKEIFRQEGNSRIITSAYAVNSGEFDFDYKSDGLTDFYFMDTDYDDHTFSKMKTIIDDKLESVFKINPKDGLQVLTPQHEGVVGTKNLNIELQKILNNNDEFSLKRGDFSYKKDDKIIQIVNNYEKNIFNGDCGIISDINYKGIVVEFDNGQEIEYGLNELDEILPSYCITIHKSQGSEYPAIIMVLPQTYTQLIDRSLIYTGITRGKKLVIIIGSKSVIKRGIASEKSRFRKTFLKEKIIEIFSNEDVFSKEIEKETFNVDF